MSRISFKSEKYVSVRVTALLDWAERLDRVILLTNGKAFGGDHAHIMEEIIVELREASQSIE